MHCQLCWIVASMVLIDSKTIADAIVCARKLRVIAESVGVKPLILYSVGIGPIASSLASVRETSSVCQPVQGSQLDVSV